MQKCLPENYLKAWHLPWLVRLEFSFWAEMGFAKLPRLHFVLLVAFLCFAECSVHVHFERVPPARTRHTTADFRYFVVDQHGVSVCKSGGCSMHCELDGHPLKSCSRGIMIFKNLTINGSHKFLVNVSTSSGDRDSSSYTWYIDTIPPTAVITSKITFASAPNFTVGIKFSEPCTGYGGFKCSNSSSCDVVVNGPATVDTSTMQIVKPSIEYSLLIKLSPNETHGRVAIKMRDSFCTDEAGNLFTRTNHSILIVPLDRRPVYADLRALIPSYNLEIGEVPRTVLATNTIAKLKFFVIFSIPVANSSQEILKALDVNSGYFSLTSTIGHANRKFSFELKNVSRINIITVKLQSDSLIGMTGTAVSPVMSIVFLYDVTRPTVMLSTSSPVVTRESNIVVVVKFSKPVFGFDASRIEVEGGTVARFKELSKALYLVTVSIISLNPVSVLVPEGKVNDISGNLNLPSEKLEVRHFLEPALSVALHSFVTAGILATSLAATVCAISSANLAAVGSITSGISTTVISDPSRNLLGMVGHLQVFALSSWYSASLPAEYSEIVKGLRWLIPREKLPWNKEAGHMWLKQSHLGSNNSANEFRREAILFKEQRRLLNGSAFGVFPMAQNSGIVEVASGPPLNAEEYFIYFLRGEPLSAVNVIEKMNYKGWQDLEMHLFWLGVGSASLFVMHFLVLLFLRWRTATSVLGLLSLPRFEIFLLILMLPCIGQSSAFVIRGKTTAGVAVGALLLAVPALFILLALLFLTITVFMGNFFQYKEVKILNANHSCCKKLSNFFFGKYISGRWFPLEGRPESFLARFGILFEDRKGPPVFVSIARNVPPCMPKSTDSVQSVIGRMRTVSLEDSHEDAHTYERLLGCARSAYIIIDLLRKVGLGVISGAYSTPCGSQCLIAFSLTTVQLVYLFFLKPHISRGVHVVESASLLCESVLFALLFYINQESKYKDERIVGFVMLILLFVSFVFQLVNEWHALMKSLLRLPQTEQPSFRMALVCIGKGLILPLLPRKQWSMVVPGSSQPTTGFVPVHTNPVSQMAANIVPVHTPQVSEVSQKAAQTDVSAHSKEKQMPVQMSSINTKEAKDPEVPRLGSKNDMKKLRELARASFSGRRRKSGEGSSSYAASSKEN